jgi:hypothetical protein
MARDKKQRARDSRRQVRAAISAAVAQACPGCTADFCGGVEYSRMAKLGSRTLGFRVKDGRGKYRSNIIWVNAEYDGEWTADWVAQAVMQSNG